MIDTHAHLNDGRYEGEVPDILERAKAAGLTGIVLAAADVEDSAEEMALVAKYHSPDLPLWCMVGVHPHEAVSYTDEMHERQRRWLRERKARRIVALGEIGLDYFYDHSPREVQRMVFRCQLELAYEEDIPIVLHTRDAAQDTLVILNEFAAAGKLRAVPGVCHCYTGSEETAKLLLDMGFYLGFDGPLTFKNSKKAPDVVAMTPPDRLLTETDAPYLTPVPFRGQRNEPSYVPYVLEKMAEIKGVSVEEMDRITTENAFRLFGLAEF